MPDKPLEAAFDELQPQPPAAARTKPPNALRVQVPEASAIGRRLPGGAPASQPTPGGKGELVEIGDGWSRCTPGDGSRVFYWHRGDDIKQFEQPVLATEALNRQLLRAAGDSDAEMVANLLESGASIDATDPTGTTATMKASANGDIACLRLLLQAKPDLALTNAQGRNALHIASFWGRIGFETDPGCIGALLRAGADPSAPVDDGEERLAASDLACVGISVSPAPPSSDPSATPRTPRNMMTPRSGVRTTPQGSPAGAPAIKRSDVELLLEVGPDEYSRRKAAELAALKEEAERAKQRAMEAALSKSKVAPPKPPKIERFISMPQMAKPPLPPPQRLEALSKSLSIDEKAIRRAMLQQEEDERQARAAEERAAEAARQEAAARTIQRHARGGLERMKMGKRRKEQRLEMLLNQVLQAAQRLRDGEELDEAELTALAADAAELLKLIKEQPELAEMVRERGGYEALDVLRRAKMLVEMAAASRRKSPAAKVREALGEVLRDLSLDELQKRAAELGVDPAALAAALASDDPRAALAELLLDRYAGVGSEDESGVLDSLSAALRAELERLPLSELERRARAAGIDPSTLARALASPNPKAALAALLVENLVHDSRMASHARLQGTFSSKLTSSILTMIAENVAQTALDVMLLVSPEKVLAELDREEAAAAVIQRHVRGHHSRCVGHGLDLAAAKR